MTGSEVIIIGPDGKRCILGKVRHSGYETAEWFVNPEHRRPEKFLSLWTDYITNRQEGQTEISRSSEIESQYQDAGFVFDFPLDSRDLAGEDLYAALVAEAEKLLSGQEKIAQQKDPDDFEGMLCSYCDVPVLVDLRAGSFLDFRGVADEEGDARGQPEPARDSARWLSAFRGIASSAPSVVMVNCGAVTNEDQALEEVLNRLRVAAMVFGHEAVITAANKALESL